MAALDRPSARHPGFWRRIETCASDNLVRTRLEDDAHHFELDLRHDSRRVIALEGRTLRAPWSTCPQAGAALANEVIGADLGMLAGLDPHLHCTHLLDLAVLAARLRNQRGTRVFDLVVFDPVDGLRVATLAIDEVEVFRWDLDETMIIAPAEWQGRDLRALRRWAAELDPTDRPHAAMLRRVVMVSGVRRQSLRLPERALDLGPARAGACFTHQAEVAAQARLVDHRRDFSDRHEPLARSTFLD